MHFRAVPYFSKDHISRSGEGVVRVRNRFIPFSDSTIVPRVPMSSVFSLLCLAPLGGKLASF